MNPGAWAVIRTATGSGDGPGGLGMYENPLRGGSRPRWPRVLRSFGACPLRHSVGSTFCPVSRSIRKRASWKASLPNRTVVNPR